ncbi:MAG: SDR family NAD(P)-dependent oxidoreductase [Planctomycetes bacterium]|nr:SDR family NAD(P)-dependent oxidoreductase [Planctomycetota bacterium]
MKTIAFENKFGPWALVTGGSSGLGVGFAHNLAAKGLNVVLTGRREALLTEVAQQLEERHGIQTRVVATDLTSDEALDEIRKVTDELDIGTVISNAGVASMGAMLKIDADELGRNLKLNTTAHLRISHHFGQRLVERGKGGILFVGSMAGMQGTPLGANYAGAKGYVHNLAQALNYELRNSGVHVSVVAPGPTDTPGLNARTDIDLAKIPGPVMSVDKLVSIGLKGLAQNKPLVVAGLSNRMMDFMFRRILPRQTGRNMMGMMISKHAPRELKLN